ncbi:hypothetical protein VTO73DRAFT_2347 [Trametes versicolor]
MPVGCRYVSSLIYLFNIPEARIDPHIATSCAVQMSNDSDSDRLPFEEYRVWFSPSPGAYAVIRLNPVAMVQHLDDNDALQAAMAMQTKTYLVCLDIEMALPFPDRPWYRFEARPIGPQLPPANEEEGYTPEMCIPIYPNTNHPTGRAPIRPRRPFPYGNCYHWNDNTIHIRVRARPEGFDETNAVKISARTELLIGKLFMEDILRARKTAVLQESLLEVAPRPSIVRGREDAAVIASMIYAPSVYCGRELLDGDGASISSEWSRSRESAEVLNSNFDNFLGMDIFAGPDEDLALVPLVDLWPDLAATLKEEDIASPLDLQKEIEAIQRDTLRVRRHPGYYKPSLTIVVYP